MWKQTLPVVFAIPIFIAFKATQAMEEPWKHYANWKKPDTKGHILDDFTYMKYS